MAPWNLIIRTLNLLWLRRRHKNRFLRNTHRHTHLQYSVSLTPTQLFQSKIGTFEWSCFNRWILFWWDGIKGGHEREVSFVVCLYKCIHLSPSSFLGRHCSFSLVGDVSLPFPFFSLQFAILCVSECVCYVRVCYVLFDPLKSEEIPLQHHSLT